MKENINNKEFIKKAKERLKKRRPEYQKKRVVVPVLTGILLVAFGIFGIIHSTYYQSTDDAFVEGRLITIQPRVEGPVIKLLVDDNDEVKKGDLILEIDPNDYKAELDSAIAKLEEAKAEYKMNKTEINKSKSQVNKSSKEIEEANSNLNFAASDYKKYEALRKEGIVSKQEFELAKNQLNVAKAKQKASIENQSAQKHALESKIATSDTYLAKIKKLEAEVELAKLNLSYTKIYSPSDGLVSARGVEQGNYVQKGQALMNIVPKEIWIVANFKEIQIAKMKKGQEVSIKIDTFGSKKFKGKIDSIQRSTGAKSSLFPPENAVGSYVKIVQRVPVKILFDEDVTEYNIVPGMSVVPKVKIK